LHLVLTPTKKIISAIKKLNPTIKLIGFKAVWDGSEKELIETGKKKLQENKADAIVVNDVSKNDRGFQSDTNEVFIVTGETSKKISLRSKKEIAQKTIDYLLKQL
jgi:phosphopantothenoylcysteine synthetase/decarboxylase